MAKLVLKYILEVAGLFKKEETYYSVSKMVKITWSQTRTSQSLQKKRQTAFLPLFVL